MHGFSFSKGATQPALRYKKTENSRIHQVLIKDMNKVSIIFTIQPKSTKIGLKFITKKVLTFRISLLFHMQYFMFNPITPGVFIVNFEHILHLVLVFLMLTLNM